MSSSDSTKISSTVGSTSRQKTDSNAPLRVAFLWHMHQPYYVEDGIAMLPWVRLHGTKDYQEIPAVIREFPDIRMTFNLVPSLLLQLRDYASGIVTDDVLELTRIPATQLAEADKKRILTSFFLCNIEHMIRPYPRFSELYDRAHDPSINAVFTFSVQDWRDLQVWYLLCWIGPYAQEREPFAGLIRKGRHFSEGEKSEVLSATLSLLSQIVPFYQQAAESGQIELSTSPFYHPILPLLISTRSAHDAVPDMELPAIQTDWRDDAALQIVGGLNFHEQTFGNRPVGMWPSEGSVSTETLVEIANAGVTWTASDETVLKSSIDAESTEGVHWFPWTFMSESGPLRLFFRDHDLSDRIGFVYSSWEPQLAADDFVSRILAIRNEILEQHGEDGLERAVVSVILDGENCWEYYRENGRPFLQTLCTLLSATEEIQTVTFSEVCGTMVDADEETQEHVLQSIQAGSWIGGNFRIWIGGEEENRAWDLLAMTRASLMKARSTLENELFLTAYEELLIAEGSDWFWWLGNENNSANDMDFDRMFRDRLRHVYELIGEIHPSDLDRPIHMEAAAVNLHGTGSMHRAEG